MTPQTRQHSWRDKPAETAAWRPKWRRSNWANINKTSKCMSEAATINSLQARAARGREGKAARSGTERARWGELKPEHRSWRTQIRENLTDVPSEQDKACLVHLTIIAIIISFETSLEAEMEETRLRLLLKHTQSVSDVTSRHVTSRIG